MTGNQFNVSHADLQLLSAMMDGEINDQELDHVLERMAHEPALGQAWSRLSQIQAATHHQAQAGLNLDLSQSIAARLAAEQLEHTPTPVIPFPEKFISKEVIASRGNVHQFDLSAKLKSQLSPEAEKKQSNVSHAVAQVIDRPNPTKISRFKVKGFSKQLLAHIAVAASVASITVWVQNDFMSSGTQQLAQEEVQVDANPSAGSAPAAVLANAQEENKFPVATVGNTPSQIHVDWSVGGASFDIMDTQNLARNQDIIKVSADQ